jgi:[protein-PII] uridylyltransferase
VEEYFDLLHPRYFLSNTPESIAVHIQTKAELKAGPFVMKVMQDRERRYTEIILCTYDIHGLFSMITGVMASNTVNILDAQINTLKNGIALDILHVNSVYGELITEETKINDIKRDLMRVLTWEVKVEELVAKVKPSILDRKAKPVVPTRVQVDNEVSDTYTVLDIRTQDKLGLLYTITHTLSALGLYIHISKISTKGGEATDIFYVKDVYGQKIHDRQKLKDITDIIFNAIAPEEVEGIGNLRGDKGPEESGPGENAPEKETNDG